MKSLTQTITESFATNKSKKDIEQLAIEYILGKDVYQYHDEANNYVYKLTKASKFQTIPREDVLNCIKQHRGALEKSVNESEMTIPQKWNSSDLSTRKQMCLSAGLKCTENQIKYAFFDALDDNIQQKLMSSVNESLVDTILESDELVNEAGIISILKSIAKGDIVEIASLALAPKEMVQASATREIADILHRNGIMGDDTAKVVDTVLKYSSLFRKLVS